MKILISGAGVGGLGLAGFLKDCGIEYTIIDEAKDFQHSGFSIGLWSNGRAMLQKLGLGDRIDQKSIPLKRLTIHNGSGAVINDYNLSLFDIEVGQSVVHISRTDLHDWLYDAAGKPTIRMQTTIAALTEKQNGIEAILNDGSHDIYDVVIGADGIHSRVRELLWGMPEKYVNWRAWWVWVGGQFAPEHTIVEYVEPKQFVVLLNEGGRVLAVMMAHMDHSLWDEEAGRIERLKKVFDKETAIIPRLFEGLEDKDVMPSDLMTVEVNTWHRGHAVLIGDAAHAITPFTALGASMALEDAYILAGELVRQKNNVPSALASFEAKRRPRFNRARMLTERMRMLSAINSSVLRRMMNVVIPYIPARLAMHDYLKLMEEPL